MLLVGHFPPKRCACGGINADGHLVILRLRILHLWSTMERSTGTALQEYRSQAIRFWERGRLLYWCSLTAATVFALIQTMAARPNLPFGSLVGMSSAIALISCFIGANACFSVVYLFEFLFMGTRHQKTFHGMRALLLLVGSLFGSVLAYALAQEWLSMPVIW